LNKYAQNRAHLIIEKNYFGFGKVLGRYVEDQGLYVYSEAFELKVRN
jgi:hypothetical protein